MNRETLTKGFELFQAIRKLKDFLRVKTLLMEVNGPMEVNRQKNCAKYIFIAPEINLSDREKAIDI